MKNNLNKWMKDIDGGKELFSLSIPGTHDSATKYVQLSKFAKCQDEDIYSQLMLGVRAIDIRVEPKNDKLALVHGITKIFNDEAKTTPMFLEDVLDMCYKFLKEHPSEAVIFQFKNDSNKKNEQSFNNLFYSYIKGNEDKWYLKPTAPTLDEARGKLILVRRCKLDKSNSDFKDNTGIDFSLWVEQDKAIPNALTLNTGYDDFIIQDRFRYKPINKWNKCVKPFLDNNYEQYSICYLSTAGGLKGPQGNAEIINPLFLNYQLNQNGIFYLDFITEELTRKIILNNIDSNI